MLKTMAKEQKFYNALRDIFVEAKIEIKKSIKYE